MPQLNSPARFTSLGTRRLRAQRRSAPNLMEWLLTIFVQLSTIWYWSSRCDNGQLQRFTFRPLPYRGPVPALWFLGAERPVEPGSSIWNAEAPLVKPASRFESGIPRFAVKGSPWSYLVVTAL